MGIYYNSKNPGVYDSKLAIYLDATLEESYPGSGGTWFDLSGRDNHGTFVNSPTQSRSAFPYQIDIQGSQRDYVDLAGSTYQYTTQNTCLVAFKPANVLNNYGEVFQKGNRLDFHMRFSSTTGRWQTNYYVRDSSNTVYTAGATRSGVLTNNQWYIAQMTIDCQTNLVARFYLNGIKYHEQTISAGSTLKNDSTELRSGLISQGGGIEQYTGGIGMIRMFDRFLDESEIQLEYNSFKGRFGL
jgi:hypothetical protein